MGLGLLAAFNPGKPPRILLWLKLFDTGDFSLVFKKICYQKKLCPGRNNGQLENMAKVEFFRHGVSGGFGIGNLTLCGLNQTTELSSKRAERGERLGVCISELAVLPGGKGTTIRGAGSRPKNSNVRFGCEGTGAVSQKKQNCRRISIVLLEKTVCIPGGGNGYQQRDCSEIVTEIPLGAKENAKMGRKPIFWKREMRRSLVWPPPGRQVFEKKRMVGD